MRIGPFEVSLPPVVPTPPHLLAVANGADGGLDLHTTGPKASWKIFADVLPLDQIADGSDPQAMAARIEVGLNGIWIPAERLEYLAANGVWEIGVTLPSEEAAHLVGEVTLQVRVGTLVSNPLPVSPLP
jgi:hypothetical protein